MPSVEAKTLHPSGQVQHLAASTVVSGEFRQMPDGRAGYLDSLGTRVSGDPAAFATEGVCLALKSTSVIFLPGQEVWWDPTNNFATYALAGRIAGGFFIGLCIESDTVAAATTYVKIDLNKRNPAYVIDLRRDGGVTVLTAAAGAVSVADIAGMTEFKLVATNEAECVDLLSYASITTGGDAIAEMEINIVAAAGSATDLNFGLANATSTTDADAIAESFFVHVDGASQNILAESDDGTTEVAATDTTIDWVAGTTFFAQFDVRDPASCKLYINGARMLSGTTFVLTAATGPLKLLVHCEKTAGTNTAQVKVGSARAYRCLAV